MKKPLPFCFIIWGYSNSGKDTTYSLINKYLPTENIKLSQPCKDTLERWLSLPTGSLNDKDFRSKQVVNTITGELEDYTYTDLLVRAFDAWNLMVPWGWLTVGYVKDNLPNNTNLAFTDIRRHSELEMIKLHLAHQYNLVFIHLEGRGKAETSDRELIKDDFSFIKDPYTLYNPPEIDIKRLDHRVKTLVEYLVEYYNYQVA